jgi:hypothetical protein
MAASPAHKFGQDLGNLLEYVVRYEILMPRLEAFSRERHFYLDSQGPRPARPGKKVTWVDKYGNSHDLDFVIEAGGTPEVLGRPVAFIEAAWRRYTKHSKNKVQEIQGAILPIIELHQLSAPFHGAVLAGDFSAPALTQLRNNRFSVLYIPYETVVSAFRQVGFDVAFDESTPDEVFAEASARLKAISPEDIRAIRGALTVASQGETDRFMEILRISLERFVTKVLVIPLYGTQAVFSTVADALAQLTSINVNQANGTLHKVEVIVDYNNGDVIRASFVDLDGARNFLITLEPVLT